VDSESPAGDTTAVDRPLIVDLIRAYEGLLFGVVVILLALVASAGTLGPAEFAALLVVAPVLMVLVMRRGAPSPVFRVRAAGAVLGWVAAWALFPVLFPLAYLVALPLGGEYGVFTLLAILDGLVLGLILAAVDRIGLRRRSRDPIRND
jgi:hypothetical protein